MSREFDPQFDKWLTFTITQSLLHGRPDPQSDEFRAEHFTANNPYFQTAFLGEGGRESTKIDDKDRSYTFRYLGRINLYGSDAHTEVLFINDGRTWVHIEPNDRSQPITKGFTPVADATELLEGIIQF